VGRIALLVQLEDIAGLGCVGVWGLGVGSWLMRVGVSVSVGVGELTGGVGTEPAWLVGDISGWVGTGPAWLVVISAHVMGSELVPVGAHLLDVDGWTGCGVLDWAGRLVTGKVVVCWLAMTILTSNLAAALRYAGMVGHKLVGLIAGVGAGAHKLVSEQGLGLGVGAGAGLGVTSNGDSRCSRPTAGAMPMVNVSLAAFLAPIPTVLLAFITLVVGIGLIECAADVGGLGVLLGGLLYQVQVVVWLGVLLVLGGAWVADNVVVVLQAGSLVMGVVGLGELSGVAFCEGGGVAGFEVGMAGHATHLAGIQGHAGLEGAAAADLGPLPASHLVGRRHPELSARLTGCGSSASSCSCWSWPTPPCPCCSSSPNLTCCWTSSLLGLLHSASTACLVPSHSLVGIVASCPSSCTSSPASWGASAWSSCTSFTSPAVGSYILVGSSCPSPAWFTSAASSCSSTVGHWDAASAGWGDTGHLAQDLDGAHVKVSGSASAVGMAVSVGSGGLGGGIGLGLHMVSGGVAHGLGEVALFGHLDVFGAPGAVPASCCSSACGAASAVGMAG
jgi:hypothetical protein